MNKPSHVKKNSTDKILTNWDAGLGTDLSCQLKTLAARREFLAGVLKSGAGLVSMPLWSALQGCDRQTAHQQILKVQPWQTLAAVQQQLFPDDGNGPSARDFHAALYLKFVLEAPDTEAGDKKFLLEGVKWLNSLTNEQFGKAFVALDVDAQDRALKKIASSNAGERWLSLLLLYIIEALLSDPVYGGNPQGIGWRWLEHQPGFPRPPKNRRYTELL